MILDGLKDVLVGELQQSGVLTHLEGLERIRQRVREHLLLVGALPPALIPGGWASLLWLRFFSFATLQERLTEGARHHLFQMEVLLGSGEDVAPASDVMLQKVLVPRVGDL